MESSDEHLGAELEDLSPQVQEKAMEIAKRLMEENEYSEVEAIKMAIIEVEEGFIDNQA